MTPLTSIESAARALSPADLQQFRAWFDAYADAAAPPMRIDALGPHDDCRPEDYADFNEQAYDELSEALKAIVQERAVRDRRKLESVEDRLDSEDRRTAEKATSDALDALFLENDPTPPADADPVDRAEWECRDFPWMTPPAYACLRVLLDEAAEAAEARLAEVEGIYDGLRALAHQRYGTHNRGFGRGYATSDHDD